MTVTDTGHTPADGGAPTGRWSTLYTELRRLARAMMRAERREHILQTTALVHEAWLRLGSGGDWVDRGRFLGAAAHTMRCILVDHARARARLKRRGATVELEEFAIADVYGQSIDLLALDAALDRLAERSQLAAEIVELRFFGGMSHEEIALARGVSLRTVERTFRFARAFLYRDLGSG